MQAYRAAPRPLGELVADFVAVPPGLTVSDLTLDSRAAIPGALFLACRGRTHHGMRFAPEAVARGARAVLYEPDDAAPALPRLPAEVFVAPLPALSERAGLIADRFFGAPSERLTVAGITGTNGKTTCAWLLAQALQRCQRPCGYLGTLGVGLPPQVTPMPHTTPDAVMVQRLLAALAAAAASGVSMEVSSHALDQGRVNGVRFHTASFTNLTRDHLDYHGTMEHYGAAKARLFAWPGL
ncbi:MAG TPA: Mur ligase family protein, partial [Steroidobacteraceae bacterium]|nr:Mur ligase family protein [Steroidobacteraceae bacterium]